MSPQRLGELKHAASQAGIELEAGARGMTADRLKQYIHITRSLNAGLLRFVIDGDGFVPSVEEVIRIIRGAIPELESGNVRLAIENHDRLKAAEFVEIITGADHPLVGICLDSVNSMGAGEGIESVTTLLAPYTFNLHIKDFEVKRHPHKMGFTIEGTPAGRGQLELAWMLRQLGDQCRTAILELWTPPEKNLEETLKKEQKWALESLEYLKSKFFQP
jgi:3-oxoisoapionate decarboxylase